jgi:periplasmic copper chaperone A
MKPTRDSFFATMPPAALSVALSAALWLASGPALAQAALVKVEGGWARPTVQGQKSSGAFMRITAQEDTQLVGLSSPVAGVAEVHEMKMDGDIMKMRALPALTLPAGQTVQLKPGGYHVMRMDLKIQLAKNSTVPMTLRFKNAKGTESKLDVTLPVTMVAPGMAPSNAAAAGEHNH